MEEDEPLNDSVVKSSAWRISLDVSPVMRETGRSGLGEKATNNVEPDAFFLSLRLTVRSLKRFKLF